MTELLEETKDELIPYEKLDDPNHYTHIINPPDNQGIAPPGSSAKDIVDMARFKRVPIVTLCGLKFIPVHNPEAFDACKTCIDIAGQIMREYGE